jgi:hypothetical protein
MRMIHDTSDICIQEWHLYNIRSLEIRSIQAVLPLLELCSGMTSTSFDPIAICVPAHLWKVS